MVMTKDDEGKNPWDTFQEVINREFDQSRQAIEEVTLMLDQSQAELNKLTPRNTAITVHLQQVQSQIESLPRADIRMAYDAALDAQHRLFVMRGQLEKLQSDQEHMRRYIRLLEDVRGMLTTGGKPIQQTKNGAAPATVEMLTNAQEAERQRLSRQMHDGPAQALSNFILQTEIALKLFDIDQDRAREELANLKKAALVTFQKVRNYIFELRPMMLDDLGLAPTISKYGETLIEQTGVDINVIVSGGERRLEPYLEVMVFRALQELLNNAIRYSQASVVKVQVNIDEISIRVSVNDNGKGISPDTSTGGSGVGINLIRERVDMLDGSMIIDPVAGEGTRVSFQIPSFVKHSANPGELNT